MDTPTVILLRQRESSNDARGYATMRMDVADEDTEDGVEQIDRKKWKHSLFSFQGCMERNPEATQVFLGASIVAVADLIAQLIEADFDVFNLRFDLRRNAAMFSLELIVYCPAYNYFYEYMEQKIPTNCWQNLLLQLVIDQGVAAPLYLATLLPSISFLEGHDDIFKRFSTEFTNGVRTAWTLCPFFQLLNFAFVPVQYRMLGLSVIDLVYMTGISLIKHVKPA